MATVSRDIALNVAASIQAYQREMAKMEGVTQKEAKRAALKLQNELAKAEVAAAKSGQSAGSKFAQGFKNVAAAGAVVAGVAAGFAAAQQKVADWVNELKDAETRTGIAAETLNGLKLAAEGSGLQFSDLESSLNQWPKRMADAARGTGEAKAALEQLGVSTKDANGNLRDSDEVFRDVLKRIGEVESPTQRAAIATQAFGEAGGKLLQALGDPGNLDAFVDGANRFGVDVGPQAAASAASWQRETALLGNVLKGGAQDLLSFGGDGTTMFRALGSTWVFTVDLIKQTMDQLVARFAQMFKGFSELADGNWRRAIVDMTAVSRIFVDGTIPDMIDKAQDAGAEYLNFADKMAEVTSATDAADGAGRRLLATQQQQASAAKDAAAAERKEAQEAAKRQKEAADERARLMKEHEEQVEYDKALRAEEIESEREARDEANRAVEEDLRRRKDMTRMAVDFAEAGAGAIADLSRGALEQSAAGQVALFALEKAGALARIGINTAEAVTKVAAQTGIGAAIAAPAMVALGATQAAAVVATSFQPSYHAGGVIQADGAGNVAITAQSGESILSRAATARLGREGVDRLNAGQPAGGAQRVDIIYRHEVFNRFVGDNLQRRDSPLRKRLDTRSRRYGQR